MSESREKPKDIISGKVKIKDIPERKLKSTLDGFRDFFLKRQGGYIETAAPDKADARYGEKHIRTFNAQKNAGLHGGWKPWERNKIWAPARDKDGNVFVPKTEDSRQQRRRRELLEAYAYMNEKHGPEPRRIRRAMARARLHRFRMDTQKALKVQGL
jgi:hypothetical protein